MAKAVVEIGFKFDGFSADGVRFLSAGEVDRILNRTSFYLVQLYRTAIFNPVKSRVPVDTGRLRRSMRMRHGKGRNVVLEVDAHYTGAFARFGDVRGFNHALEKRERNRLDLLLLTAFERAFNEVVP